MTRRTLFSIPWMMMGESIRAQREIGSGRADQRPVSVYVVERETRRRVPNARVFVLANDGKELTSANTGPDGVATLPALAESLHPKYLLVERENAFVVGRRWLDGQLEYLMPMSALTPPGLF